VHGYLLTAFRFKPGGVILLSVLFTAPFYISLKDVYVTATTEQCDEWTFPLAAWSADSSLYDSYFSGVARSASWLAALSVFASTSNYSDPSRAATAAFAAGASLGISMP